MLFIFARSTTPFSSGELFKECILEAAEHVMPLELQMFFEKSFAAISKMSHRCHGSRCLQKFYSQLRTQLLQMNVNVQIVVYVHRVNRYMHVTNLFDFVSMKVTTRGVILLKAVEEAVSHWPVEHH